MKKFTYITIIFALCMIMFVSCDTKSKSVQRIDDTVVVNVTAVYDSAKALSDICEDNDFETKTADGFYWKYFAKKSESDTGEKLGETVVLKNIRVDGNKGLDLISGLSKGLWDLELHAYLDPECTKEVYYGKIERVQIPAEGSSDIEIRVSHFSSPEVSGTVEYTPDSSSAASGTDYKIYTVNEDGSNTLLKELGNESESLTLKPGPYMIELTPFKDVNVQINIQVFSNTITEIKMVNGVMGISIGTVSPDTDL